METNIEHRRELAPHRYCVGCGLVKVEGDGRGRSMGYYISLVSALSAHLAQNSTGHRLTKIDVRLICQEIRGNELFLDTYGSRQAAQERVFIEVVMARRGDLNRAAVREFIRECGGVGKRKRPRST